MRTRTLLAFLAVLLFSRPTFAATQLSVTITQPDGAPLKDALVILVDLAHPEHELTRALSDAAGKAPMPALAPGLYRVIATDPYSSWQTTVREFLVKDSPVNLNVQMSPIEGYDDLPVTIGQLTIHVIAPDGTPASRAHVIVRDIDADPHSESSGVTNAQGSVTLQLTRQPDVILVVYRQQLYSFRASGLDTERTLRLK